MSDGPTREPVCCRRWLASQHEEDEQEEQMTKETKKPEPKEIKKSKAEEKIEQLTKTKQQELSLLETWKKTREWTEVIDSPVYFELQHYIKMVCKGISRLVIINGAGGLGKSYNTVTLLNKSNVDYGYTDSYSTPAAFYIWMFQNKEKVIVLDDIVGIFEDKRAQSYLKSATWEVNGARIVTNMSTKHLEDEEGVTIPNKFEFTGSIIILTNKLNMKNAHMKAIITRANYVEMSVSYEEKLKIIEKIAAKPFGKLTSQERTEIFNFLKENTSEATSEFNLRMLIQLYQFYQYSKDLNANGLWQRLGMKLLKKDELCILVEALEKKKTPVKDKIQEFKDASGKGRATYFRIKERIYKKSQSLTAGE